MNALEQELTLADKWLLNNVSSGFVAHLLHEVGPRIHAKQLCDEGKIKEAYIRGDRQVYKLTSAGWTIIKTGRR